MVVAGNAVFVSTVFVGRSGQRVEGLTLRATGEEGGRAAAVIGCVRGQLTQRSLVNSHSWWFDRVRGFSPRGWWFEFASYRRLSSFRIACSKAFLAELFHLKLVDEHELCLPLYLDILFFPSHSTTLNGSSSDNWIKIS
jgi:hypothetical protein